MDANKLYYYRKTMPMSIEEREKRKCKYFNYSQGVAGFVHPQSNMELYLYGTQKELEYFLKHRKIVVRFDEDLVTFRGSVE